MADENEIEESSDIASENEYDDLDIGRDEEDDDAMTEQLSKLDDGNGDGPEPKKQKLDPKDPLRPRRKKARRACFACQRAHLTCGDERPCQRCIKRGLADACQDGVRKKAKYLHDAPAEALRPVLGPSYNAPVNGPNSGPISHSPSASDTSPGLGGFFPQVSNSPTYHMQFQPMPHNQMPPPIQSDMSFMSQPSPLSPTFSTGMQRPGSMHSINTPLATTNVTVQDQGAFSGPLFDPSNPALYNFDLDGLQFGNQYGAMEFSMLNHMSSGVIDTPIDDQSGSISQQGGSDGTFAGSSYSNNVAYGQMYPQQDAMMADFSGIDRQNSSGAVYDTQRNFPLPRAYVIETGLGASPSTDAQASPQSSLPFDSSPTSVFPSTVSSSLSGHRDSTHQRHPKRQDSKSGIPKLPLGSLSSTPKRTRDSSSIYTTVKEPYSYTTGFHSLIAYIQRRFPPNATLKIAKSLASIRPSFISCTKTLNRQDLIFMEKCFQRTLFEYEDFMRNWGTPTVVCRRTGEVEAVNKEFTLLTGWTKSVMLGREANLNINTGTSSTPSTANPSGPPSLVGSGRAGLTTPRMRSAALEKPQDGRPQHVFVAELLDDTSVIEFYDDFAKLAFGDSRGSVTKRCKLLKYQPKPLQENREMKEEDKVSELKRRDTAGLLLGGRVSKIDGEFGIGRLERDGKMDCAYCWTVKRDVFDIPMLIVMNFLPCIPT